MPDEQKEIKIKRFSLSKEEREKIGNFQSVMGILAILRKGMDHSITLALMEVRQRLSIKDTDAPEGYTRSVDYDPQSDELIVRDIPNPPEPAKDNGANLTPGGIIEKTDTPNTGDAGSPMPTTDKKADGIA